MEIPRLLDSNRTFQSEYDDNTTDVCEDDEVKINPDSAKKPVTLKDFPSEEVFGREMDSYLSNLHEKKRTKALLSREMYNVILDVLKNPDKTSLETAQFRFWVRKMFKKIPTKALPRNGYQYNTNGNEQWHVTHHGLPVATKDNIYDVLVTCHQAAGHGGRDKTMLEVKKAFSWIPKDLVSKFVRNCPTCHGNGPHQNRIGNSHGRLGEVYRQKQREQQDRQQQQAVNALTTSSSESQLSASLSPVSTPSPGYSYRPASIPAPAYPYHHSRSIPPHPYNLPYASHRTSQILQQQESPSPVASPHPSPLPHSHASQNPIRYQYQYYSQPPAHYMDYHGAYHNITAEFSGRENRHYPPRQIYHPHPQYPQHHIYHSYSYPAHPTTRHVYSNESI